MKVVFFIIIFLMSSSYIEANNKIISDTNYIEYHELINQAERYYFLNSNVDSSLAYYDKAFEQYSFIFLKDLVNAAQISVFERKLKFKEYILKGFKFGLQIKHLHYFPLLKPLTDDLLSDTLFMIKAKENRNIYLESLNYGYLLKIYDLGIEDQIYKNKPDREYSDYQKNTIIRLKAYIEKFGFPSSKFLGIESNSIFTEVMNKPQYDLNNRKLKFSYELDYYKPDDEAISFTISMIILIHNECAFMELEKILYNSMLKGEIHPREIGCLYDNMFDNNSRYYKCSLPNVEKGLFYLNLFLDYKKFSIDKEKVNNLRSQWNIVEVDVDEKKKQFEEKYGFKLFYGFWKCM